MMKTLVAVLCFALVATSVRGQDQESRLLTAIRKPQITEVALNTTVSNLGNITVAFNTGPNLPGTTFSVKCVAGTQGCNGPAAGDGEVTSPLPLKSSYVEADVTNVLLGGNNTYQCFVSASAGKFSKCIEANPLPGSLTVFVRYLSYTPETFGAAEKAQLCKNLLALAPGTCDVVAVRPGSAIAETLLVYDSFFTSAEVYSELVSPSNATLEILGAGLGSADNIDGVLALPPSETVTDVAPSPPANVVATASGLCTPAIDVSWQAPGSGTIVTEYVITCVSSTSAPSSATVPGSATTASVAVLTGVEYQCSVFSNGPSGTSSSVAASPVAYEYKGSCFSLCGYAKSPVNEVYSQFFEQNSEGWVEFGGNSVTWSSGFTPTFNGTDGFGQLSMAATYPGPFSRFRPVDTDPVLLTMDNTPGGIVLQLAFYLDVSASNGLTSGQLVDYSVALNLEDPLIFVRDYVFNFGFYDENDTTGPGAGTRRFVISRSNNAASSGSGPFSNPKNPNNDPIAIEQSGWYIFAHKFYPQGNDVFSQLSVFDSTCTPENAWDPVQVTISGAGNRPMTGSDSFYVRYGWVVLNQLPTNSLRINGQVYAKPMVS